MAQRGRRRAWRPALAALGLVALSGSGRTQESAVRCLVPWSEQRDVPRLVEWFRVELGEPVTVLQVSEIGLGTGASRTATLLLGYEVSVLKRLEEEGVLAPFPSAAGNGVTASAVAHRFFESWSPVQTDAGVGAERQPLRSWWDLTAAELWGAVILRLPDAESREGLILGQMAHERDLSLAFEVDRLVLGSLDDDTLRSPHLPHRRILEELQMGQATLAPVREVVRARRDDWPVSYVLPEEGFYAVPLGAAFPAHVHEEQRRRIAALLEGPPLIRLCRALDLEPVQADTTEMPEWMSVVVPRRVPVDPVAAYRARTEIARVYDYGIARNPEIGTTLLQDLFDFLMILLSVVILAILARTMRPQRRVRRA